MNAVLLEVISTDKISTLRKRLLTVCIISIFLYTKVSLDKYNKLLSSSQLAALPPLLSPYKYVLFLAVLRNNHSHPQSDGAQHQFHRHPPFQADDGKSKSWNKIQKRRIRCQSSYRRSSLHEGFKNARVTKKKKEKKKTKK